MQSMTQTEFAGRPHMAVGAVNNEFRSASLAILDMETPASSPQTDGSPFACTSCPAGRPRRYFLLPRSELTAAFGDPYNFTDDIVPASSEGSALDVSVREHGDLRSIYRFSRDLMPESVSMSDRYWEAHREFSRTGKLDHSPEECSERVKGVFVRMWEPAGGWKDLPVRSTFSSEAAAR